jgi:hypothetical protein
MLIPGIVENRGCGSPMSCIIELVKHCVTHLNYLSTAEKHDFNSWFNLYMISRVAGFFASHKGINSSYFATLVHHIPSGKLT